jgi:hypothetical protein
VQQKINIYYKEEATKMWVIGIDECDLFNVTVILEVVSLHRMNLIF